MTNQDLSTMILMQSGFLAYPKSEQSTLEKQDKVLIDTFYDRGFVKKDFINFYDKDVQKVFRAYTEDTRALHDFEFRENLIKLTFLLFKGHQNYSIQDWFLKQEINPIFNSIHEDFLKETINYVIYDEYRIMGHQSYRNLLHIGRKDVDIFKNKNDASVGYSDFVKRLLTKDDSFILTKWTSSIEKITDLIMTLDVIFGLRSQEGV